MKKFFTEHFFLSLGSLFILIIINILYTVYLKPDITTTKLIDIANKITIDMSKLDENITISQKNKIKQGIEKSLKELKVNNLITFTTVALFPIITFLFALILFYASSQIYVYLENIKEIKSLVRKTHNCVENAHMLNPDEDCNLSARAQVLNIFNRDLYTDSNDKYSKTVDILFSNDYYSYLLTKSYLDYFFYRIQRSDMPIRYIVVDKYSHGLLVYSALCKHAGYEVKLIKKKKYLEVLSSCVTREYFIGNPFFVFAEDSKILRTTYMTFSNEAISITDEEKNKKNYEIIKELDKIAFTASPTTEINSTFLKGFIGE